MIKATLRQVK